MSPVMHLVHVLHTRDATCSALNTVCVKTELSAVVESHRDGLRLLWLVLRSEHYCVRTHTHARSFLSSHTKMIFSGRGGDVCRHPPTHLPSLMHWNLQHFCQVPHKCLYFTHPLTSSLCVPLALCSIHVPHTLTHNLVCVCACYSVLTGCLRLARFALLFSTVSFRTDFWVREMEWTLF